MGSRLQHYLLGKDQGLGFIQELNFLYKDFFVSLTKQFLDTEPKTLRSQQLAYVDPSGE